MSGTDPDPRKSRPLDRTQAFQPEAARQPQADDLPKIPGITLHFELARGGMGVVYSGRQDFLDRRVAVKLLSVELGGDSFVQRFQREAKILAGIKHPNIVSCHMAGQTEAGQSYLVMEFVDGPSLKKWIGDNGVVPVKAALRTTRAIAQALGHAHSVGIIHRDVKPENILLETVTSTALDLTFPFTPKVVDLGLARSTDGTATIGLTSPGSVMGTPATMSPEQFDEPDAVDFRTDIYGIGCVLYEMLVGQPAYRGRRLTDIIAKKREVFAPNPCAENRDVPAEVGLLVQWMLANSRDDRPSSYKLLDEHLAKLIDALGASVAKSTPAPVVGEETGSTIFVPRSKIAPEPKAKTQPPNQPPAKPDQAPAKSQPALDQTGPGLLRSAEINFLAEGLETVGAAQAPPAFQSGVREAPPGAGKGTRPGGIEDLFTAGESKSAKPAPGPAPAPKKRTGVVAAAVVVALGLGGAAWFAFGGGGSGAGGTNKAPTIEDMTDLTTADLRKQFTLTAVAADPEGKPLTYAWTIGGDLLVAKGPLDQKEATFQFDDGLPGLDGEIKLVVSDGEKKTEWKHTVTIGSCPVSEPMAGFKDSAEWVLDKRDAAWTPLFNSGGAISCRAKDELRTMTGSLGDEAYWEWFGSVLSEESDKTSGYATVGGIFEIGGRAWAIVCRRSGDDGANWSVEAVTATRTGGAWTYQSLESPVRAAWTQPDTDDEHRAMFSVQRLGNRLRLQVGAAIKPPTEDAPEVLKPEPPVTIDLPKGAANGSITWFVDKGRGEFRIKRR